MAAPAQAAHLGDLLLAGHARTAGGLLISRDLMSSYANRINKHPQGGGGGASLYGLHKGGASPNKGGGAGGQGIEQRGGEARALPRSGRLPSLACALPWHSRAPRLCMLNEVGHGAQSAAERQWWRGRRQVSGLAAAAAGGGSLQRRRHAAAEQHRSRHATHRTLQRALGRPASAQRRWLSRSCPARAAWNSRSQPERCRRKIHGRTQGDEA